MKRQKAEATTTTRVYQYGSVPARVAPVRNDEGAAAQMRLANRLWNTLVAIDRTRLARYRRIMQDENQDRADALKAEIDGIRLAMRGAKKATRSRKPDMGDMPERLTALKAEWGQVIDVLRATKDARHAERRAALDANTDAARHRIKRARQAAASMGLFWGSYNDIVQRADAGRKLGELQFRRYTGDGTLTAQIMGGVSADRVVAGADVFPGHTFFQIDAAQPIPQSLPWGSSGRAEANLRSALKRRGQKWRYARMRIGSNEDRSPVWVEIPIVYHRDIPADALIKSVSMTRRTLAGQVSWRLNVTATVPVAEQKNGPRTVAIDLGWRLMPEGVRVAYWHNGTTGSQVLVPMSDIDQFRKVESLRSTCDLTREEIIPVVAQWLSSQTLNEEWTKRAAHVIQWRSGDRLAALIRWWADNRLQDDDEVYQAAWAWRRQYLHLANWWRNLSDQLTLRLREQYRVFAAQLARDYDTVLLEDFDLRDVAEKQTTEKDEVRTKSATYRQMVSPSTFRGAVRNACLREGVQVLEVASAYTTRQCSACGSVREWDQAETVMHRCVDCKRLFDQDENAALNLLRNWQWRAAVA